MLTLGDARLTMLNGGNFRLDGGAMHGVVPKTLWSKLVSCDALNRCEYATRCLLVEAAGKRVLVETGNGDKFPPKLKDIYGIDHDRAIGDALREVGLEPDDIDTVVMTHLHFDHSGGTTRRDGRRAASSRCSSARATSCSGASGRTPPTRTSATAPATCRRTSARSARRGCCSSSTARPRSRPACASSRRPATPPATSRC